MSLARLFHALTTQGDFEDYTAEEAALENVFLNVLRQDDVWNWTIRLDGVDLDSGKPAMDACWEDTLSALLHVLQHDGRSVMRY